MQACFQPGLRPRLHDDVRDDVRNQCPVVCEDPAEVAREGAKKAVGRGQWGSGTRSTTMSSVDSSRPFQHRASAHGLTPAQSGLRLKPSSEGAVWPQ